MKVVVIGAGGIIGQHMMITVPPEVDAVFTRQAEPNHLYEQLDVTLPTAGDWINNHDPDIIVNLAGESRPDVVEQNPDKYREVNSLSVGNMASWCDDYGKHLIHVSSQAALDPVNEYGKQKRETDEGLEGVAKKKWVIVRPTFVLGIRPFPGIGRENPAERILSGKETYSVNDRHFAVSFAWDVAEYIWKLCVNPIVKRQIHYVGQKERLSRYDLACLLGAIPEPVTHGNLPGLAPRPMDTSGPYAEAHHSATLAEGITRLHAEWEDRRADGLSYRVKELAAFLRVHKDAVAAKMSVGFGTLHQAVTEDFHRVNPVGEEELLEWYRRTESYLYELTAYHSDAGFNYRGMVTGITSALKSKGVGRVLCLGDGTGDLSLAVHEAGMLASYNDLSGSLTASFAESRFFMRLGDRWARELYALRSMTFVPPEPMIEGRPPVFDAVVSLDFLEHVVNVDEWIKAIYKNLKPGGFFCCQNAFNMGSGPDGAMPMHLSINDHYEKDWDPLLFSLGFVQLASNWYQKPA